MGFEKFGEKMVPKEPKKQEGPTAAEEQVELEPELTMMKLNPAYSKWKRASENWTIPEPPRYLPADDLENINPTDVPEGFEEKIGLNPARIVHNTEEGCHYAPLRDVTALMHSDGGRMMMLSPGHPRNDYRYGEKGAEPGRQNLLVRLGPDLSRAPIEADDLKKREVYAFEQLYVSPDRLTSQARRKLDDDAIYPDEQGNFPFLLAAKAMEETNAVSEKKRQMYSRLIEDDEERERNKTTLEGLLEDAARDNNLSRADKKRIEKEGRKKTGKALKRVKREKAPEKKVSEEKKTLLIKMIRKAENEKRVDQLAANAKRDTRLNEEDKFLVEDAAEKRRQELKSAKV